MLKTSSQKKSTAWLSEGQPTLCTLVTSEGDMESMAVRSSVLGTYVMLAPYTASAVCACKGARAGYS